MYSLICIGHSHMDVALYAYQHGQINGQYKDLDIAFVQLQKLGINKLLSDDGATLHPHLDEAINDAKKSLKSPPSAVFLWIGGSNHQTIGLLNHPIPYDFVLPDEPNLPVLEDRFLFPYKLLREVMRRHSNWKLSFLSSAKGFFSQLVYQFQSPPPIPSDDHIRSYPGPAFQELVGQRGVSPLSLRYKLWLLHSSLYRECCKESGITYLSAPHEALDHQGCMNKLAWGQDSIHANVWYGHHLINQIYESIPERAK